MTPGRVFATSEFLGDRLSESLASQVAIAVGPSPPSSPVAPRGRWWASWGAGRASRGHRRARRSCPCPERLRSRRRSPKRLAFWTGSAPRSRPGSIPASEPSPHSSDVASTSEWTASLGDFPPRPSGKTTPAFWIGIRRDDAGAALREFSSARTHRCFGRTHRQASRTAPSRLPPDSWADFR